MLNGCLWQKSSGNNELDSSTVKNLTDGRQCVLCPSQVLRCILRSVGSWLHSVNKCQRWLSFDDGLGPGDEEGQGVGLTHALEAGEGRHSDADTFGADGITDGIENPQWEAETVLEAASIRVCAVVGI